jgi:3',5'-cyclic AMP phosphodiesterase CpdA
VNPRIALALTAVLLLIFGARMASAAPVTIAATADIACPPGAAVTATTCRQQAVGDLIRAHNPDRVIIPGDIQYNSGAYTAFQQSYDKAFGSLNPITLPAPGNHEYGTAGAAGYAQYFGDSAPYWYSTDIGSWHVITLDSNCGKIGGCGATTPQATWLKADLAAHPAACTLAQWHHPRWNSGEHSGATNMGWAWKILYAANADVILNGHEHSYQRFAPLTPAGVIDRARGIREFVVGTGGKSHYAGGSTSPLSEYRNTTDFGATFFTLDDGGYTWAFTSEQGQVLDEGTGTCH